MVIVFVCEAFNENMGYAENLLPKALADIGADVHIITTIRRVYYQDKSISTLYNNFPNPKRFSGDTVSVYGYTIHYLDFGMFMGKIYIKGLGNKIRELRPDVVQTFSHANFPPMQLAAGRKSKDYLLFTGNHTTASVFPLAQRKFPFWHPLVIDNLVKRRLPGYFVTKQMEKCYGATSDCSDVAVRFMSVPTDRIVTVPLGVDTDIFYPAKDPEARESARAALGYRPEDIVCIYTGRLTAAKNPLLLARAIDRLSESDSRYKALFFGQGEQESAIAECRNVSVKGFVPFQQLAEFYRLADIGVWPTQESTSMIDAAACGLPIIVNDTLRARERIDGNGITYRLNDLDDLVRAIGSLDDGGRRRELGYAGAEKMLQHFSWKATAKARLRDYDEALHKHGKPAAAAARAARNHE